MSAAEIKMVILNKAPKATHYEANSVIAKITSDLGFFCLWVVAFPGLIES